MASKRKNPFFAPLPLRAIGDVRLGALDFRVLGCIGFHDRMSGPRGSGRGCYAGNEKLAAEVGCHYTRLSVTITKLVTLGYLKREQHLVNKRWRTYRLIYNEADYSLPNGKVSAAIKRNASPSVTPDAEPPIVCDIATNEAEMVCRSNAQATKDVEQSDP